MDYSWCVCDLDGTLLDSKSSISAENKDAVERLNKAGIKLILATGRSDLMVKKYVDELGIETPVIACNGGIIREPHTGRILYSKEIKAELVQRTLKYCYKLKYEYMFYTADMVYYSKGNKRVKIFQEFNNTVDERFRVPLSDAVEFGRCSTDQGVVKILVSGVDLDTIANMEAELNKDLELTIVSSGKGVVDIMAANTSKGEGLRTLAGMLGIDLKRTAAFGDNYNDLSLFRICALPIAVGNAEYEVKQAAKLVTFSNDESGVGYAIKNYILK